MTLLESINKLREIEQGGNKESLLKQAIASRKRNEKLEEILISEQDAKFSTFYAHFVINGRWPEAEPYIKKSPEFATYYARHILKRAWKEAEPYIKKDNKWWKEYVANVKDVVPSSNPKLTFLERRNKYKTSN